MKLDYLENALLYIHPSKDKSSNVNTNYEWYGELLIQTMLDNSKSGIFNRNGDFNVGISTMGHHTCICGEQSHSCDYLLPNNMFTNSLSYHYLQYHYDEIPEIEFEKLKLLRNNVQFIKCKRCEKYHVKGTICNESIRIRRQMKSKICKRLT